MNRKPRVAFICVHNSCRSQMAEALGKHFAGDVFESFSAGTEERTQINQDAVRLIKEIYSIDMEKTQHPKLLPAIPEVDIVIKMGCNVICPFLPSQYEEDWGLDDPSGKSDEEFKIIIDKIEDNIKELSRKITEGSIVLQ
ncbi:MAG: arsenate reductase ArsC [Eubacteriales bacterium]|nr:arsenate reductase ArsC [Eubacteriales bacterium]